MPRWIQTGLDGLVTILLRGVVALLQAMPLRAAARVGRAFGGLAHLLAGKHRRIAIDNITHSLGKELSRSAIRAIARENFRRIGENFACAVKTASLDRAALRDVLEVNHAERMRDEAAADGSSVHVAAVGHFGNFELYACLQDWMPGFQFVTTYRAVNPPGLDRVLQALRAQSGCLFFERRSEADALKRRLARGGVVMGLLADQNGGEKGVWGPFLGRDCSTMPAPAVFALRYETPLHVVICYRVALARWRIEVGEPIPVRTPDGKARPIKDIVADMNQAFEEAIRQDPANWFWIHRRWKPRRKSRRASKARANGADTPSPSAQAPARSPDEEPKPV